MSQYEDDECGCQMDNCRKCYPEGMTPKEPDMRERCNKEAREIVNEWVADERGYWEDTVGELLPLEDLITTALLKREKEIEELKKDLEDKAVSYCNGEILKLRTQINDLQEKLKAVNEACLAMRNLADSRLERIESLTSQLKIVSDLIKAPCNMDTTDLQKLNACKQAIQKISEVGNKKSTAKDWLKWAGKIDLSEKSEDGHGDD